MVLFIISLFIAVIFVGLPIAFCLCVSSIVAMVSQGLSLQAFVQNLSIGINSFPLLAVPFFILAGKIMNLGGITKRIFAFANAIVGPFSGGLAQVNIFSSLIFAGMSGAAIADAAGLGVVEIKAMKDSGYDSDFSVAITAASSTIGPIIPPSIIMIIYGITARVSIGKLFIGGIIPGLIMTVALMILTYIIAMKRKYPKQERQHFARLVQSFFKAVPALITPLIIVGGILAGIFTPTEAGSIAVLYAIIAGVFIYKELKFKELPRLFIDTMRMTSIILFIVASASVCGWVLTYYQIPANFAQSLGALTTNPVLLTLLFVCFYILLGCFLEAAAIVVMTVPVILPLLKMAGIDPVFFGVLISMCMSLGTLTPPVGTVMFIMCNIGGISIERFSRIILPFLAILLFVILIVALFPGLVLFLPQILSP